MQNYNQQQQAIIAKGIAQQILDMSVPTFGEVNKMVNLFNHSLIEEDSRKLYISITYRMELDDGTTVNSSITLKRQYSSNIYIFNKRDKGANFNKKIADEAGINVDDIISVSICLTL